MEDRFIEENVKHRLIISGISELEEHGIGGFSLRRAAIGAQVSCAAPYRHFKDKDEYINEIISYVGSKWELLSMEIKKIFSEDPISLVIETCIANLRFRIANRNFPLALAHTPRSGKSIEESISSAVSMYCNARGMDDEETELKIFSTLALIDGAVARVKDENTEHILSLVRKKLATDFI